MAIDPTKPVLPTTPLTTPAVGSPDRELAQAMARAAVEQTGKVLGEMVSGSTGAVPTLAANPNQTPGAQAKPAAPGATPPPTMEQQVEVAVRETVSQAAPRQASLAPAMANFEAALARPDVPAPVKTAARAVLDRALPTDRPIDASALKTAIRQSGVFLEARLAAETARTAVAPNAGAPPQTDLKASLLVFRAVVSSWLGKAATATTAPAREGASKNPTSQTASEAPRPTGYSPPAATSYSPAKPAPLPTAQPAPGSLETDEVWIPTPYVTKGAAEPPKTQPAARPVQLPPTTEAQPAGAMDMEPAVHDEAETIPQRQPPAGTQVSSPPRPNVDPALPPRLLLPVGLIEDEDAPPTALTTPLPAEEDIPLPAQLQAQAQAQLPMRSAPRPPPPYPGGPTAPQAPAEADLPQDLPAEAVARRLLRDVDGAVARQELMQVASLARRPEEGERPVDSKASRWNFELPFQTPQGYAVAQFEISRDGGGGGAAVGEVEKTWRVRFSLDVEPLGPVHVSLSLTGVRTRVALWAERPEAMARLREAEETLGAALRQVDLEPELAFHAGAPVAASLAPGRFVDRAS